MYKFEFKKEELDIIIQSLGEMPSKLTRNLLNIMELEFQKQTQKQFTDNGKVKEKVNKKNA